MDNYSQKTSSKRKMPLENCEFSQGGKRQEQLSVLHTGNLIDESVELVPVEHSLLRVLLCFVERGYCLSVQLGVPSVTLRTRSRESTSLKKIKKS